MSRSRLLAASIGAGLLAVACGGNSGGSDDASPPPTTPPPTTPTAPTLGQRTAAATATAQSNSQCLAIQPFYWEIGDGTQMLASGAPAPSNPLVTYTRTTNMSIASASKWMYGSYVVQRRAGALTADDIKYLHFESGYTSFTGCDTGATVGSCQQAGTNGVYTAANDGKFFYGGGHMEKHAVDLGLGPLANAGLAAEIESQLGSDVAISYTQPQLAGGVFTNAGIYSIFLRKIVADQLRMHDALGTNAVCTNPATCPTAVQTPSPRGESWHYSVGHWVEDDPTVGDGAFSSPGAFGFYPWIDASKTYYGIVARFDPTGAIESVYCGRLIRKAWLTGVSP